MGKLTLSGWTGSQLRQHTSGLKSFYNCTQLRKRSGAEDVLGLLTEECGSE